jgi:glycosyltransferase involved in cell wall biosynthesis
MTRGSLHVISGPAPFGGGGLGRHLAELVAAARASGAVRYFAATAPATDPDGEAVSLRWLPRLVRYTPLRFRPDWQSFAVHYEFDRAVARRLPPGRIVNAFAGSSLRTFRRARELGFGEVHLESAGVHVAHARRMYDAAYRGHPVERDWLSRRLLARIIVEYAMADVIWVNSEYGRGVMLAAGVPAGKVRRRVLTIDPRFRPPERPPANPGLHVVYVGTLSVSKGVPVLLEAFARLSAPAARLTLVGGSGSRGMRRYLAAALARDPRVRLAPGDPLPHLHAADVFVHPSFADGFGYAPAEALACGVPVVVTEDTGMKELVQEGVNGYVVPTGSADAILDRLEHLHRRPLRPVPPQPSGSVS